MLSDSDRMKLANDDTYTHSIGYAMKGYSLKVQTIHDMIKFLRNVLHQYDIPVLCECFDGQWANLAFKDREGDPLTILHLLNKSWEVAHNLSRRGVLLKLKNLSTYRVQDLVSVCQDITYGKSISKWGNISATVKEKKNGEIYYTLESNGGHLEERNILCHTSMHKVRQFFDSEINNYSKDNNQMKPVRGIQPDDVDIISALEPTLVKEIYEDQEIENNSGQAGLEDFLASPKLQIIADILIHLQELGKSDFWADCTEEDLFPHVLMDKDMLMTFTKHDLDIIGSRIENFTIHKMFSTKDNKDMKAAKIAFLFGSGQLVYSTHKKVPMLKVIAQNVVKTFPLIVLQSVYVGIMHVKNKWLWNQKLKLSMLAYVPILKDWVALFYHPEFSHIRKQHEVRTMDYTHQLTNLPTVICKRGIQNVKDMEFKRICDNYPEILSKGIVYGSLDKQCASFMIQLFSPDVEQKLVQNKAYNEALFTKLVQNWYNACDSRSMSADDRVNNLWAFYAFLTKDIDFDKFPGFTQYIKGIPIITYARILQNISVRLSLYTISKFRTYNH